MHGIFYQGYNTSRESSLKTIKGLPSILKLVERRWLAVVANGESLYNSRERKMEKRAEGD